MGEFTTYNAKKLLAQCSKCNHMWNPYPNLSTIVLPHEGVVTCPQCNNNENLIWGDSEFKRKEIEQRLELSREKKLSEKVHELENKFSIMEKELELLKQKQTLSDVKIENVKSWADKREKDFLDIEMYADEEREREKMQEDGI